MEWNVEDQPPELWDQFKTDYESGAHIRIHPLLHWTELNIWEYIQRENIPVIPLYFANERGERYRASVVIPAPFPSNPRPAPCLKSSRNCALPIPRNGPAALRTRKAKTPSRSSDAMATCKPARRRLDHEPCFNRFGIPAT